jgi:glycosyltransferase involved in cell wall biosynthesis
MKKTICLNMIVKNEAPVIKRCLESVKHIIDYWVIVDTGSTDGTQKIIKEFLKDIPGELHEHPWVNFGYNRNEALKLTRGKSDYALFIDADDRLIFSDDFFLPDLEADAYYIKQRETYKNTFRDHTTFFLLKTDTDYHWKGVLHEGLYTQTPKKTCMLPGVYNEYINDGSRSKDPQKIKNDIKVLKKGIKDEPDNARYSFYLARTYWSIRDYRSALKYFEKRIKMEGDVLEVYHSLLYTSICQRLLNFSPEIFINNFCKAHLYRPSRAEAMYELARYFVETGNFLLGYFCAKIAMSIPITTDHLFVESWIHEWGARLFCLVCSYQLGYFSEAQDLLLQLDGTELPQSLRSSFHLEEMRAQLVQNKDLHSSNLMVS